jgi:hypothetical protein
MYTPCTYINQDRRNMGSLRYSGLQVVIGGTDNFSLLFNAYAVCRLAPSIAQNFLNMLQVCDRRFPVWSGHLLHGSETCAIA